VQPARDSRPRPNGAPQARGARDHCTAEGRPCAGIDNTPSARLEPGESAASFAARCRGFTDLAIEHMFAITLAPWRDQAVATLAAAARELA
jgi:hypothetical protein